LSRQLAKKPVAAHLSFSHIDFRREEMTGKDIFKKYSEGVFGVVEQEKIKASAFTLGAGLYVTVSHPLEDPESIKLRKQNGEDIHAKVLGWDNRYDLAVLEGEWGHRIVGARGGPGIESWGSCMEPWV
jgi:S1-C subfamily serine protease